MERHLQLQEGQSANGPTIVACVVAQFIGTRGCVIHGGLTARAEHIRSRLVPGTDPATTAHLCIVNGIVRRILCTYSVFTNLKPVVVDPCPAPIMGIDLWHSPFGVIVQAPTA